MKQQIKCPYCGATMEFIGYDFDNEMPYSTYWECFECGMCITSANDEMEEQNDN